MSKLIKRIFVSTMMVFSTLSNVNPVEWVSMNNQECKVRPEIVNVIKTSKCSGSCNNINYTYAKLCVPDVAKNLNIKDKTYKMTWNVWM